MDEPSNPETKLVRPKILLVDDDPSLLDFYAATLGSEYEIGRAQDGKEALALLASTTFDMVISDLQMPGMDGLQLLRAVRDKDLDLPVMLITGSASLESALEALEYGAFRYLTKPVEVPALRGAAAYGVRLRKMAKIKRQALGLLGEQTTLAGDRAGLESRFGKGLDGLWMAYQPIVSWSKKLVFAYEALVRTDEASLGGPGPLFEAAESLDRLHTLGQRIRASVGRSIESIPSDAHVFVNLHPRDFDDDDLYDPKSPLSQIAQRVVLEVSERASLETVKDARPRIAQLRKMGFRIAIDDLGAGHAGLSTFTHLEPDVVKLDMSLVRGADKEPTKRKLIKSMTGLCKDLNMIVITEGVETAGERDAVVEAGCDLLQGYLFGKPARKVSPAVFA
jgi:EAL domain-containing protein (putative c-di-GMP-specific phosphodiesterase class I)/ActR/RegA family two-component response regulator